MISNRMKKRFSRIVAGLVSAAMTLTMVPDVWLPVYAEIVRDEIANAEIEAEYSENSNDDLLTATDSASAPDNYVPINSEEIQKFSLRTATFDDAEAPENKTQVLLIEDIYPWNSNANSSVLNNLGVTFKKVKTADFLSQDLGNYSVIVFANDQQFSAYNNYSTFKENIERFAELGGVVVFGACDGGWANATLSAELPGGVTKYRDYDYYNYITDNDHPIITAELSDGNKLTDDLLYSNYCSHISFNEDTLPNGSNVILRGSKNNAPTLVEYPYGKGHIIASGLTWEHNYSNYNRFGKRVMDDLFLYALHIANTDVNMQPPIAVSVDAPQSLAASAVGYSPNPFNVKALLKNISEETVNNVQVKIVLPNGLKLSDGSSETIEIGVMDSNAESNVIWKVKASSVNAEKTYTYKIIVTAENGYEKIVTKRLSVPEIKQTEKMFEYTVFSASQNEDLTLNGWKSNFTGGIYSGRNFVCNLSEFYLDGKVDAAGTVTANGWKINIPEKNENIEAITMPALEEAILAKAGEYTYYAESPSYIQDTNIINGSIMVSGDVTISGTNFEGDCYIIADKDITYNVNNLNTTGRLVLYSRNGNITVNGTNINIDGIMYAPKGKVSFNSNETTVNGRIWADTVNFSGSIFNIKGSDSDLDLIGDVSKKGITKTYTTDEDFSEGTLDGVSLAVPDQLILAEKTEENNEPVQKIFGDADSGNGVKLSYSADKSFVSQNGEAVNITYGLSGFGEIQNEENAIDLIIVVDESGSMSGKRMTNAKSAAKEVISQMKLGDRCAVIGFEGSGRVIQSLTEDKELLYSAVDKLRAGGGNNICNGLQSAIKQFDDDSRQKYIMLISDGEDSSASAAMATTAGEKGIRILAMMVGTGSLQMQTVAINSNGIYKNAPTAEDIGKIMKYFASEVFNTAGRNTTFKTTVKDKNSIDLNAVTPKPDNIIENTDGSITLEWTYDRISINETENITLPVYAKSETGFADLIYDTSCVYYDKNGKPNVIYVDDVSIPVSEYVSDGKWTVVFDSEQADTKWSGIYWNGIRYGDGQIRVSAAVSDDGSVFGEAVPVSNYGSVDLTGRYIRLNVDMSVSSDGKTPELFDITVTSENIPEQENSEPVAAIYTKLAAKVNVPVNMRGVVSDDCLSSDALSFEWSCTDGNVVFADKNSLITSAVFSSEGEHEIKLAVNDGEKITYASVTVNVVPADKYDDIDPSKGEAAPPEIAVKLPRYADRNQKITAKIESLNSTEIAWYSVIINTRTAVNVSDDGEFTLTMGGNGTYKVVVRAFDWSGKSDTKEYTIIVNSDVPTIEIIPSAEKVYTGEEAYFTVNTTLADKIKTAEFTLNGEAISIHNKEYKLDTSEAGTYTLTAKAVTNSGRTVTASASIEVIKSSKPVVDLSFDKESYGEGDDVIVTVIASDENGIAGVALEYDGKQVELDENNSYTIKEITAGEHTLVGVAWNAAGIVSSAGYTITIEPKHEQIITIEAITEKSEIYLGETARLTVNVNGGDGTEKIYVDVNGKQLSSDTNVYEYTPDSVGEYIFNVTVETASGASKTLSLSVNVVNKADIPDQDTSAPTVEVSLDKDIYYEGDDIIITVNAEDNVGVANIVVTVNEKEISPEESGKYIIKNAALGTYEIKATAYDAAGNSSWVSVFVPVNEKGSEPADKLTLEVNIDTSKVKVGEPFDINITANGGVGEKTISCTVNNESVAVENSKASYTPEQFGTYEIAVSAVDEAGSNVTKTITLTVSENGAEIGGESGEKIVTVSLIINNDRLNDGEHNEAKVGDEVSVFVEIKNLSDDEIKSLVVTVNGKEIILDADKKAVYIPEKAGEYLFNAVLNAKDGNVSDLKYMLYVTESGSGEDTDEPDESELFVEIASPDDVKEITAPTDIIGSAKGSGLVKYTLEYAPAGTNEFTAIHEGTEAVDGGVLGQLDPTMLRNGYYDIRLTGYTGKAHKSDTVTVYVTGQMKIGNFSIAFQDMDVNVPGLALTVVRGYDSRDRAKSGDFGYGWNLSMTSADISESGKPSENWSHIEKEGMFGSTFKLQEDKSHEVSIDWGSGKTEKFRMTLSPNSSLTPITAGITVSYKAQKGTKSTLEPINKGVSALVYSDNILMYADGTPYAPAGYKLTKQDGTVYYFDADGNVTKIIDTNGSTIEMTYDGIIHSDGKSINYNRDSQGRITSIVSPTGKTVEYTYDNNGDLTAVKDVSGYVTRFEYDDHYITNIIDPRGVNVSRNIYDDNGRLIKTIDSDGNEIAYDHDIDGRQEVITDRNGNITLYVYDDNGNVLSQTDPNGNTVKNTYDSNGNLDKTIDALGNITDYGYSESGDLLTLTDAEGHTVNNSYNSKGQLTSINAMGINTITIAYDDKGNTTSTTDALGNDIDYSYDSKGQLTSVTDEIGSYMNMTYDSNGNVISATNGAGTTTQFTYDADGNCTSKTLTYTSEEGVKSVTENYFYDAAGNLIKIIDSEGNVTATEYNSMGKVSSATDEKGRKTSYDYDDFGNLVKITYPDNTTEAFTYDREGNNLSATDRMGRTVTMKYDKVGNLVSKTYPNGAGVSYVYDSNYNLVSETSASGGVTYYEYDKIGRNTAIIDALGNRTTFFYNAKSQLESMTDPMGRTYTYSYDDNGNRIKTTYPDGTSVSSVYDARGRVTRQSDQHGYNTYYVYDGADRLIRVTNAQGISTSYTYDEVGNMITVTDGNGNVTAYAYDGFGRVVKTTNALGNSAYTTYDKSGNVLTSTDYAGNITSYVYDDFDRLVSKTNHDGTVNYTYTADGKISTVTDSTGTTMFTYDLMDGLTRVDYPDGNYVSYSYDNACRLTSVTTPFGTTAYEYDLLDRLTRVVDRNGYATVYEYDANGNRTVVHYANGFTTTYDYDLLNRLIKQETVDSEDNIIVQYIYTLGAAGERKSVTELDRTVEYSYDSLYRLASENITEDEKVTVYTYAYDNVSNRILKTVNGEETVYTYNALNQLVSENDIVYEYDLNGNTVRMISPSKSALYVYNAENRLIRATVQSGNNVSVEEYKYDYAGNRIAKSSEGEYTKYLLDINGELTYVLAEMNYDGTEKCYYTRGNELISQERDGKKSYYVYDGHGSVRALADESGKVTDTYVYDAFGNLISSYGSTKNDFLFAGEQFDPVTGLYYFRARYMNPSVGTFISMDNYEGSIDDPVSLHKYLYCNSDPVNNYDPSGYNTLAEMEATTGIQGVLNQMITPNVKALMNLFDGLSAIWDIADTARTAWNDGLRGADLAISIACGVMTSILTNFSCQILALGPLGVALFAVGALVLGIGIGMALAEGDGSLALSRVAQLIGVLFSAFSPSCFTGDTVVLTSEGLTCIEDVEVGDSVWAYNSEIGKTELKEVLCVWVKETDKILHVSTSYGETIDTTTNHPFYVEEKGWVAAGDLVVGDTLVTVDGDEVEVTNVELEKLAEPILVYNLDVADFDTYFVGEYGALVHNYSKRNQKLAGKEHPVSGVLFDSDANPQFESFFDAVIDVENYTSSDKKQFDIANNQLKKAIMENESLKSIFDEKQIAQIMGGKKPSGYVWHHSQEPGVLQLVDEYIHKITGHTGGRSLWGGGSSFR